MKTPLVVLQVLAAVVLLCGLAVFFSGNSLPVYTDSKAPEELSHKLQDLPREERFSQWYQQLAKHETSHKRLTDLGRGLIALGLGVSIGALFLHWLPKTNGNRVGGWIAAFWTILWVIKFPLTMWYYSVRQSRFDYPVWGDSIAIGVFQDFIAWVIGFIAFSILLAVLMIRHRFAVNVALRSPTGGWGWLRAIGLWLWMALLVACILPAIGDGDEGMVISCTAAIPVILLALSAPEQRHNKASLLTPDPPRVPAGTTDSTLTQQSEPAPGQA
ncbi:MAG: hypothetical protein ACSHYF_17380 [Verrucomicrobiaceae bacterium]